MAATFTLDEARALLRAARTPAVLDAAKTAVLAALQSVTWEEHRLSEADAAGYAASINAFTDAFALDEWVLRLPLLNGRVCNYPLCFEPPRAPTASEGDRRRGGNPPLYCAGINEKGQPHGVSKYAIRRRDKLREAAGRRPGDGAPSVEGPVSEARATFATGVERVEEQIAEVGYALRELRDAVERGTDETLVQSEIEAVRHQANEEMAREGRLRVDAELRAHNAEMQAQRAQADLARMAEANRELQAQADRNRDERDAALSQVNAVTLAAQKEISSAKEALEQELAKRAEQMRTAIEAAQEAQKVAMADAEAARERAVKAEAAAGEAVTAREELSGRVRSLSEEGTRLRDENTGLRNAAVDREREIENTITGLHTRYQQEINALRAAIDEAHQKINETRDKHDAEIDRLRSKFEEDLAARLHEAEVTAARIHEAELGRLRAEIEVLNAPTEGTRAERKSP